MTLHDPKHPNPVDKTPESRPANTRKPARRDPKPLTLGDLLGAQIRGVQAARARRAELDAAGFRAIGDG